jgi:hypothetical protein
MTGVTALDVIIVAAIIAVAGGVAWSVGRRFRTSGRRLQPQVLVRCRAGHLFTMFWPGAARNARLGISRLAYCPACRRWTFVTPADD